MTPYIAASCWYVDHWVRFKLNFGTYQNIITFFQDQKIYFLAEMSLDFTNRSEERRVRK